MIGPGAGGVGATDVVYATVTGYAAGGSDNNDPDAWGDNCTKLDNGNLGSTYLLTQSYDLVIVKSGSEQSAPGHVNTLFADASAGETVFADSNGSGVFDDGDKGISHIIFCGPETTTTTTTDTTTTDTTDTTTETTDTSDTTTETTATTTDTTSTGSESEISSTTTTDSSSGGELGAVGTPGITPPSTDTVASSVTPGSADGFRFVLLGLATLLAVILLLQPKGVTDRR